MKKALCSIGSGPYEKLLAISSRTFTAYGEQHSYEVTLRSEAETAVRPAPWAKVPLILDLLEHNDLVLWLDADAIIVDGSLDIAAEVQPDRWMYLTRMKTGEGLVPNTGVWMFTRCEKAKDFLLQVDGHMAFKNHKWWENAAVIDLLGYDFDPVRPGRENAFTSGVHYLDHSWNSAGADPAPHPRIKHYPALPIEIRRQSLLVDLDSCNETNQQCDC